jgi:hypothetical protein
MRMKIIRKVEVKVLSFCQRPTDLCLESLKVMYDKGIRVLEAEISKLSDWRAMNC